MTFVPLLKKFIMVISTPTFSPYTVLQFDTYFLESDAMTGPWRYATYMRMFGPESYFVNIPTKFLGNFTHAIDGSPALAGTLSYSANFAFHPSDAYPTKSGYYWCLQPMRLVLGPRYLALL
jgi:hypothetical protein